MRSSPRLPSHIVAISVAASLLLLSALPAQAQWKWRDRNGQINASDRPPPLDVPEKDILDRPRPGTEPRRIAVAGAASAASAPAVVRPPVVERELEARRRAAEQAQADKARAEEEKVKAQRAENCQRARSHVATLESGQRLVRVNEKGEREVLDDRSRADELRRAREIIASDCR